MRAVGVGGPRIAGGDLQLSDIDGQFEGYFLAVPGGQNDLDLRVFKGDETYLPFTLDPLEPEKNAVPGDNVLDNVEQIILTTSEPGAYTIEVSRKYSLTTPEQWYSLISDVPLIRDTRHPGR